MQGSIRFLRHGRGWRLEIEFTREPEGSRTPARTPRPQRQLPGCRAADASQRPARTDPPGRPVAASRAG